MSKQTVSSQQVGGPWYKEPLMWLVLGLPATVVVAGFVTLYIAASNPETLVTAPHSKIGFTVEKLTPQLQAPTSPAKP
ncbi:MAG: FixH family protein [Limnobacter sp.]|nr:FixH family protein [Limnobacter sp.]